MHIVEHSLVHKTYRISVILKNLVERSSMTTVTANILNDIVNFLS